ncbi:MAG: carbohydrate ABC transporter permease, partial [Candidatus Dormibacteraceae bacterium]
MSVATAAPTSSVAVSWSPRWITDRIGGVVLHIAVISLTLAWMVPTIGLLVTSFRVPQDIANSG